MKKTHTYILLAVAALLLNACGKNSQCGFAIVIDPQSLQEAQTEVEAYAAAIEETQGLKVYTIVDEWGVPDSIRARLYALYNNKVAPIVGAVFIGDIPVPMVRDAQHMTSAFKMDQSNDRRDSSVPSDRFYDDFDLCFDFLGQDTAEYAHLFYYSLTGEGAQRLSPDIFTGRIRPTDAKGSSRYEKLRAYLSKAIQFKRAPEEFNAMLVFNGNGSLSESNVAHIDEFRGLMEHLPHFCQKPECFSYIEYSEEPYIEHRLMNELMRPDLGVAMLHHHGDFDTQYLSAYPRPRTLTEALEFIRYQARANRRTYIRRGATPQEAIKRLRDMGVPADWLKDAGQPAREREDSIIVEQTNITLDDFGPDALHPNVRVSIFDACYNAAFQNDDCIANEYIFQPGGALVGLGGSVNVLQDKWPDRFLGLLAEGMMVGYLAQHTTYLEWHVIGDPTFCFAPRQGSADINTMMGTWSDSKWLSVLDSKKSIDIQAMAIYKNAANPQLSDDRLLDLLKHSPYAMLRLEAFAALKLRGGDAFVEAMQVASCDNYELLQRFAVNEMQQNGDPRIVPSMVRLLVKNNASARVRFNATMSLQFLPKDEVMPALEKEMQAVKDNVIDFDALHDKLIAEVNKSCGTWDEDIDELLEGKLEGRKALRQANFMRIYTPAYKVPSVCEFANTCSNDTLVHDLLEALGWHGTAYTSESIVQLCQSLMDNEAKATAVRNEAQKTLKRVRPLQ